MGTVHVSDILFRSRMPLVSTIARVKLLHACDQCHSSWVSTAVVPSKHGRRLSSRPSCNPNHNPIPNHGFRPNTEGDYPVAPAATLTITLSLTMNSVQTRKVYRNGIKALPWYTLVRTVCVFGQTIALRRCHWFPHQLV
jgi:hypothetical protein